MLAIFASVGASRFDLTFTDACGRKVGFRPGLTLDALRPALGQMLRDAASLQHNVIVRPRSPRTTLVQLDDLDAAATDRVKQASFLVICTSPGSYQAWVAVDDPDADFARRLRRGAGADPAASGATRIGGSLNFKAKYEPGFPQVQTVCTHPGLVMTQAQLEALGVVSPAEKAEPDSSPARVFSRRPVGRRWPDYQRCLENAPAAQSGDHRDVSRADFTWCLIAIDWGWTVEETAARLLQESNKAQENGEAYALRTARNAGAAIDRRGRRQR